MFHLNFNMIKALRLKLYGNMVRQPAQFFDKEQNSSGNLVGILADEIRQINGASFELYAFFVQGIIGMIAGIVLSMAYFWQIGLIAAGSAPITGL